MPLAIEINRSAASDVFSVFERAKDAARLAGGQNAADEVAGFVLPRIELGGRKEPKLFLRRHDQFPQAVDADLHALRLALQLGLFGLPIVIGPDFDQRLRKAAIPFDDGFRPLGIGQIGPHRGHLAVNPILNSRPTFGQVPIPISLGHTALSNS